MPRAFAALVLAAGLGAAQDAEIVKEGKRSVFKSETHRVTVSVDAGWMEVTADEEALKDSDDEKQRVLMLGQTKDENTVAFLVWHKQIAKDTKLEDYRDSILKGMGDNMGKVEKLGTSSPSKEVARVDYNVITKEATYRGVAMFLKSGDKYYDFTVMTRNSWLSERDKVEDAVKTFGPAK